MNYRYERYMEKGLNADYMIEMEDLIEDLEKVIKKHFGGYIKKDEVFTAMNYIFDMDLLNN